MRTAEHSLPLCRIVIIAKAPVPGSCKTRLVPALGAAGAASLAVRMLRHTVQTALDARLGPVELCAAPTAAHPRWAELCLPTELDWSDQGDGDLGQRMARAAERTLARGEYVILVGSDCPAMTALHLQDAAGALQRGEAAMIPTFDGGYALLGLAAMQPTLFADMPWSTSKVASITVARITEAGFRVHLGHTLHDMDVPADLAHLPADLDAMPLTNEPTSYAP